MLYFFVEEIFNTSNSFPSAEGCVHKPHLDYHKSSRLRKYVIFLTKVIIVILDMAEIQIIAVELGYTGLCLLAGARVSSD
jgi:hypothetical protein